LTKALLFCYAGLHPEVAKRIVTAAEEKNLVAEATGELAGRQVRAEVAQISGCLREKIDERRGSSAKRSLSQEVAHKEK